MGDTKLSGPFVGLRPFLGMPSTGILLHPLKSRQLAVITVVAVIQYHQFDPPDGTMQNRTNKLGACYSYYIAIVILKLYTQ